MNKLKLISALLISLSIGIIYAKDAQKINDQAEEVIYLYAEIIDSKNFSELKSIMQTNFKMTGMYEINSLEEFMFAMQELNKNFIQTMHFIGNINGEWIGDTYSGKTYCIASHIFKEGEQTKKLDMGIIYTDVIKLENNKAKFVSRDFKLIWSNTTDVL